MKTLTLVLSTLILSCSLLLAHPTTEDSFAAAWKSAVESKDLAAIEKLTYLEGLSTEERKDSCSRALSNLDWIGEIAEVTFEPLDDDFEMVMIAHGKKSESLTKPIGLIKLVSKNQSKGAMSKPYTVIDGKYYCVAAKITNLDWKGPRDTVWNCHIIGKGADNIEVEYSWNASGVDLTRKVKRSSNGIVGQHINWIKVTSKDPDSELVLELLQGDKDFYQSEPLKGIGTIEYKKPN